MEAEWMDTRALHITSISAGHAQVHSSTVWRVQKEAGMTICTARNETK